MADQRTIGPRNVLTLGERKTLGPVVQSWVSTNPGLKFNLLFKFLYFYMSVYLKNSGP